MQSGYFRLEGSVTRTLTDWLSEMVLDPATRRLSPCHILLLVCVCVCSPSVASCSTFGVTFADDVPFLPWVPHAVILLTRPSIAG